MGKFFQTKPYETPFRLFSPEHLAALAVIALAAILLFVFRKRIRRSAPWRNGLRYLLAALLLLAEISYQAWLIYSGKWSLRSSLPLELSDLSALLAILLLINGNRYLFSFLYFAGIGSSLQALLTPDLSSYAFPHFLFIEFFTAHGGMILACLLMIAVEHYRPSFRSLWTTFLIVTAYGAGIFFLDRLTDANYLYLVNRPKTSSVMDFLGPQPWHLLSLEALMLLEFVLLYVPFAMIERGDREADGRQAKTVKRKFHRREKI
ncbi:TIGR02206 family membrane protein [Sporolactobacillus sp. CQH2019]|uniref:YwaF family protein n=1 Tax=Sporolactobacillus sp. CQH2019 TaxID=3023512 RepID=UPI0023681DDA|nr:TIGR02206 family membrane protein [Sporolactobacillus sp. CQH2019]MDD9149881.1 TIGR02206 family membrane protein [Sporolactobacillus sp. CQH2019]